MRFFCLVILLFLAIIEVGPLPVTPFVLIWVVVFRPEWFYRLVMRIYARESGDSEG